MSAWKQAGCTSRIIFPPDADRARVRVVEHTAGLVARPPSSDSPFHTSASSVLALHHDPYLAIYFASVLALCAAYVRTTALDVRSTLSRHWKLGSLLGLVFGVALVRNVFTEDATPPLTARTSSLS